MSLVFGGEIGKTEWYTLYAGSLDDPSAFHPTFAIFAAGRPDWAIIPPGFKVFDRHAGIGGGDRFPPIASDRVRREDQLSGFFRRLGGRRQRPLVAGGDGAHIPCCWGRWHNAGVRSRVPL